MSHLVPSSTADLPATTRPPVPGAVLTAAVITWVTATGIAGLTLLASVVLVTAVAPILMGTEWEGDGPSPLRFVAGAVALIVVACGVADLAAYFVTRRKRWARWSLVVLSALSAIAGVMLAYYVVTLAVTLAGVTVIVLLFLPTSRAWFRADTIA